MSNVECRMDGWMDGAIAKMRAGRLWVSQMS
jgi:hypothetical protein